MAPTTQEVDGLLDKLERCVKKVDAAQHSMVRLRKAELDLLGHVAVIRDLLETLLKGGDRALLREIFGDCGRIARLHACLGSVTLSEMNVRDQRFPTCMSACKAIEEVLRKDLGLGAQLEAATRRLSHAVLEARVSMLLDEEQAAALQAELGEGEEEGDRQIDDAGEVGKEGDDAREEAEHEDDGEGADGEEEEEGLCPLACEGPCAWSEAVELLKPMEDGARREASGPEAQILDAFAAHAKLMLIELDKNGDGLLSKLDLRKSAQTSKELLRRLKLRSGSRFAKFFKQADPDKTGNVTFAGFLEYLESLREEVAKNRQQKMIEVDDETLRTVFEVFDRDNDGHLSLQELKHAYASVRLKAGRRVDARRVVAWSKRNLQKYSHNSKTLNMSEFKRLLENSGALGHMLTALGASLVVR